MLVAALAVLLSLECELPPWLADAPGAIRDSATVVVDGFVSGLHYLPRGSIAEVEVELEVRRSWRSVVPGNLPVWIWDYWECGPTLEFGESYIVGLRVREDKLFALAAVPTREAGSLVRDLGNALTPSEAERKDGPVGLWLAMIGGMVALVAAFSLGRRSVSRPG